MLILGAGAAGLAAAAELARGGASALILEARDRLGGRIWSQPQPGLLAPIELGAEFVHGEAPQTEALIAAAGSAAVELPNEHWMLTGGKLAAANGIFPKLKRAMQGTRRLAARDLSFAELLRRSRGGALSGRTATFARMLVEGFDAADPERASARAIAAEWTGEGGADAAQKRPLTGYGALLEPLIAAARQGGVRVRLQAVVSSVRWRRGSVECEGECRGQPFRFQAARAIVTLPLGVLQRRDGVEGAVRFEPALREKQRALAQLATGPVMKVVLRFDQPFWERLAGGRFRDVAFFHAGRGALFPTLWTALPARAPTLVAWAGGPNAERLGRGSREEILHEAVAGVAQIFGPRARVPARLESAHLHDWTKDPFARGAYSYVTVGGGSARRALAAPLRETLFFAGEATDQESAATVEGALRSGVRAAREALGLARVRKR